jgi:TIR domain
MTKIFLSYASDDYPFAHRLREGLKNVSVEGWMDSADIAAGEATSKAVRSAMKSSKAVVVLISPKALESSWVGFEIGASEALGKSIIPILIKGPNVGGTLPEPLRDLKFIDAREMSIQEVIKEVEKALATVRETGSW